MTLERFKIRLNNARPDNQAHLLLWDTPNEADLRQIVFYNNAQRIHYREHLLQRLEPDTRFLNLHRYHDRELNAIRTLCTQSHKPMVLLEELDCLISYLRIQPEGQVTLFWQSLEQTRKLNTLLWILLPTKLKPPNWPESRLYRLEAPC